MLQLSISVFLVIFVFYVKSNEDNNNRKISTRIIAKNGSAYACPYQHDVVLTDGDIVTVMMTHYNYINYAQITLPSQEIVDITGGDSFNKTKELRISPSRTGQWTISTLTNKGATGVKDNILINTIYNGERYFQFLCHYNIKVQPMPAQKENGDKTWLYFLIGGSVLAIIIVIQTIVILYILKTKKIRRIEQLALSNNTRSASDTARYSAMPARRPSVKPKPDEDAGSIYECLDVIQTPDNDAPPPPPIETLPRPPKKDSIPLITSNNSQMSTPIPSKKPPGTEEERIKARPPMPLPGGTETPITGPATHPRTESNISVTMRGPAKPKPTAFTPAQILPTPDRPAPKMPRKPSALNQDAISNELNNILKKRQTGNIPPKPHKPPEPIPETKPKPTFPTPQSLKPPTMSKPTTPKKQLPRPVPSKNVPGLPKPLVSPTQPPSLTSKPGPAKKWSPVDSQATQIDPTPHPIQGLASQRPAHPMPHQHSVPVAHKPLPIPPRPVPVLPADGPEEEPEYAEYAEYAEYDDDEEWTYEPLTQYNIYSS